MLNRNKTYKNIVFTIENPQIVQEVDSIWRGVTKRNGSSFYVIKSETRDIEHILKDILGIENFDMNLFLKYYNKYIRTWCNKTGLPPDDYPLNPVEFYQVCLYQEYINRQGAKHISNYMSCLSDIAKEQQVSVNKYIAKHPEARKHLDTLKAPSLFI